MNTPSATSTELLASAIPGLRTAELGAGNEATLQRFFDANPQYFIAVNGEAAGPNEGHEQLHYELPAEWSCTKKWLIGYLDEEGELQAIANVFSDLLVSGVWHISLLIVATVRHGNGDAHTFYRSLESWAVQNGARWMRLGVVQGNARAERFWERLGFVEVRRREGEVMGQLTNTLRVMVKPLSGDSFDDYLATMPRDRPQA